MRLTQLVFTSLCLTAGSVAAQTSLPQVTGTVTDSAGRPMAAVLVYVPGTEHAVRTDPSGRFAFDSLPSGFITLRAEFIGYWAGQRNRLQVGPGKRVGIHFRLLDCPIQDNPNVIRESAPAPTDSE